MKKKFLIIAFTVLCSTVFAQSKDEQQIIDNVKLLHATIFGTKDSLTLEKLSAKQVTYGHSHGNVQDRQTFITSVAHNKSTYTGMQCNNISVIIDNETAVSRYLLTGTETNKEGKVTELKLNILQVWIKEKKEWKMLARQAVMVDAK
ncbi:MAG: hypothetical protein C0459_00845 [Chitinophaga sp.]|jgi:ketosteroid isomerase-like protein|nr:hypothetical protein [Chitinophaga sp.]